MPLPTPRTLKDVLYSFAVMFAAVTLGAVQFLQHSLPSPGVVHVTPAATVYVFLCVILIPTLALTVLDHALAWRDRRRVRGFRILVFAVSGTLVIRQLQLYFLPVRVFAEPVESVPVLPAVIFIGCATAWIAACRRWPDNIREYFVYATPVAFLLLLYLAATMPANTRLPANYADAVPSSGDKERPPVVVLALDEWSFSLVADDEGMLDHERYPHLASLAADGVWFTNATTNHFHTPFVIPPLAEAAADLSPAYDLTVYDQFAYSEVAEASTRAEARIF